MTELTPQPVTMRDAPKILIVDDHAPNRLVLRRLLGKSGVELIEAASGNEALALCLDHHFALILLDVNMPEMDGFEVAELLGEDEGSRETPIIFISAAYDDLHRLRGYRSGAVDYIGKPVNEVILKSKVDVFLELYRRKAELQEALEQLSQHMRALEAEVQLRRETEALAWHRASHDPLTDLPNRMLFMDRLDFAIDRARRTRQPFGLAYIDIDGFKPVNDTHGHPIGDELLKAIAGRLRALLRADDTVARLGGDEFAVILENLADDVAVGQRVCEAIVGDLRRGYTLDDGQRLAPVEVVIGASVGLAIYTDPGTDREALIHAADDAMYTAKRGGRNRCVVAGVPSD